MNDDRRRTKWTIGKVMKSRVRNWVFTLFGAEGLLDLDRFQNLGYGVYQEEICPDTGRPHFQGYLEFNRPMRARAVLDLPGMENARIEPRSGTQEQAIAYVTKDGTRASGPYEHGEKKDVPGRRKDLTHLKRKIDEGASELELWETDFATMSRTYKAMNHYRLLKRVKEAASAAFIQREVIVIVGPSGVGKSRYAFETWSRDGNAYTVPMAKGTGTYWDGYDGQETIIIDEMDGARFHYRFLLRLLDGYPMQVPIHGGSVSFTSTRIVLCANDHPWRWFPNAWKGPWFGPDRAQAPKGCNPLYRRITRHIFMHYPGQIEVLPREDSLLCLASPTLMVGVSDTALAGAARPPNMEDVFGGGATPESDAGIAETAPSELPKDKEEMSDSEGEEACDIDLVDEDEVSAIELRPIPYSDDECDLNSEEEANVLRNLKACGIE